MYTHQLSSFLLSTFFICFDISLSILASSPHLCHKIIIIRIECLVECCHILPLSSPSHHLSVQLRINPTRNLAIPFTKPLMSHFPSHRRSLASIPLLRLLFHPRIRYLRYLLLPLSSLSLLLPSSPHS